MTDPASKPFMNWRCELCGEPWHVTQYNYQCRDVTTAGRHTFQARRGKLSNSDIDRLETLLLDELKNWDDNFTHEGEDADGEPLNWHEFWVEQLKTLRLKGDGVCSDYD